MTFSHERNWNFLFPLFEENSLRKKTLENFAHATEQAHEFKILPAADIVISLTMISVQM